MRDQYLRSPVSTPTPRPTMPLDKQSNGNSAKPFTPTISNAFRSSKSPLTPKLAGYSSPSLRKAAQTDCATPTKPDISTTTSTPLLNANVTPRSAPRISRRDGFSSPADTPPSGRNAAHRPSIHSTTSHDQENRRRSQTRGARAKSLAKGETNDGKNSQLSGSQLKPPGTTTFFRADDARSSTTFDQEASGGRPMLKHTSQTTFLYADGREAEQERPQWHDSRTFASPERPQQRPPEPVVSPRFQQSQSSTYLSGESVDSSGDHWIPIPHSSEDDTTCSQVSSLSKQYHQNLSSPEGPKRPGHMKSSSVDTSHLSSRPSQPLLASPIGSPLYAPIDFQSMTNATSPELKSPELTSPRAPSARTSTSGDIPLPSRSQSPTKGQNPHLQNMNELAANARRERKVLDLEISNSSLLAINRTLEREMRKQTAELRRFRRLSRSGRLSINGSVRSVSGQLSIVSETDDGFDDQSSVNSNEPLSDDSDEDSIVSDGDTVSPNSLAEHDAKHRNRDERRFLLDLSKHQQLLIDSQKMNQSIKRCLGRTETLISEARKALEYHVRVSDVDIGGRVLSPDEIGDRDTRAQGLLSPTDELTALMDSPELQSPAYSLVDTPV